MHESDHHEEKRGMCSHENSKGERMNQKECIIIRWWWFSCGWCGVLKFLRLLQYAWWWLWGAMDCSILCRIIIPSGKQEKELLMMFSSHREGWWRLRRTRVKKEVPGKSSTTTRLLITFFFFILCIFSSTPFLPLNNNQPHKTRRKSEHEVDMRENLLFGSCWIMMFLCLVLVLRDLRSSSSRDY